jgi:hypothetical protein
MDYTSTIAELLFRHGFRRFMMSRTPVGHLKLVGHLDGRAIDIVLDTGASKTFVELTYCRSEGIAVSDTGQPGHGGNVYTLGDVRLTLEGLPVRTDGIFALDMTTTNERLKTRGVDPIRGAKPLCRVSARWLLPVNRTRSGNTSRALNVHCSEDRPCSDNDLGRLPSDCPSDGIRKTKTRIHPTQIKTSAWAYSRLHRYF